MTLKLIIGPNAISSYRRLAYTAWHALAEFVDNSTQSYFNNQTALDQQMQTEQDKILTVSIVYDSNNDMLRVVDNAMGMSFQELDDALHLGKPPQNPKGRSRYGMGMKTAACWIGNKWTITTKKLGDDTEHSVTIDVNKVAAGEDGTTYSSVTKSKELHYTIVEIVELDKKFQGRTLGRIGNFLRSMYRADLQAGRVRILWRDQELKWDNIDTKLLVAADGTKYRKDFIFEVGNKVVMGWVGILAKGSRAEAGFAQLQFNRVVRGWPDAWRPSTLFGQFQGSNDLVNQRLVGEISLDDFDVTTRKTAFSGAIAKKKTPSKISSRSIATTSRNLPRSRARTARISAAPASLT